MAKQLFELMRFFLSRIRDKKYFRLETQEQTGVSQIKLLVSNNYITEL